MSWGKPMQDGGSFLSLTARKRRIRVISARDMSVKERRTYDEQVKTKTDVQE